MTGCGRVIEWASAVIDRRYRQESNGVALTRAFPNGVWERGVNQMAVQGWEFYRVDPIGVEVRPGCLAGLFGAFVQQITYYVVTFRAPS